MKRQIPNLLTLGRMLLAPFLAWAIVGSSLQAAASALLLAIAIELTDGLDGALARRHGWQTSLGRFLDPLADSIARLTAFVALHQAGFVSLPMLLCLLYRDQLVAYLRIDGARRGLDVGARLSGKLKAIAQAAAILGTLVGRLLAHPDLGWLPTETVALWSGRLIALAVGVTLWSAIDYVRGFRPASS